MEYEYLKKAAVPSRFYNHIWCGSNKDRGWFFWKLQRDPYWNWDIIVRTLIVLLVGSITKSIYLWLSVYLTDIWQIVPLKFIGMTPKHIKVRTELKKSVLGDNPTEENFIKHSLTFWRKICNIKRKIKHGRLFDKRSFHQITNSSFLIQIMIPR